ncbi:MAG: elongation factor G [Herpetosiphonaceae bacterium]|nr:elongation factor G [Herpetosiphonaceae bacterium]
MKEYGPERIHTIGLFGHGGSGKTTLAEALLFASKGTGRLGRVEDGTTVSDYDPDEVKRHMSINLSVIPIEWHDNKFNFIDVPGYADFRGEAAAALRVIDGMVLVLDAGGGVEVGAELLWQMARAINMPRIVFINKMDRDNANFERTVEQAQRMLSEAITPMHLPIGAARDFKGIISLRKRRAWLHHNGKDGAYEVADIPANLTDQALTLADALVEKIAVTNDHLTEKYLEEGADAMTGEELREGLQAGIANGTIVPLFVGSATTLSGIPQLLDGILDAIPDAAKRITTATNLANNEEELLETRPDEAMATLVFKTLADQYVGRLSYLRVFSGEIYSNSVVRNARTGRDERIGQLYQIKGREQTPVAKICDGDIGAVTKLADTISGDTLYSVDHPLRLRGIPYPQPSFTGTIAPHGKGDLEKLGTALHRIVEEDPTLQIGRDPQTGEMLLSGLGESHLAIVAERMKRKFDVNVDVNIPRIPYRERIQNTVTTTYRHKKQTGGAGQFAEVSMRLEPLPPDPHREDPLEFVSEIVGGVISRSFWPAIEKGVREAMTMGVISGNPVVDVKVAIFDGKEHPVDSKEIAFKTAGKHGFREAARKAHVALIEPVYRLDINVPDEYVGDVLGDLNGNKRGRVQGMEQVGSGRTIVTANVPLAECQRYATDLRSMTQGRGDFTMVFDHYDELPAHLSQSVVAQSTHHHDDED